MKIYLFMMIMLSGAKGCDSQQPSNKNELPVVKTTSQAWSGGAAGSGRGMYYTIYLIMNNTDDYTFDSLWVQGKRFAVTRKPSNSPMDTVILSVTDATNRFPQMADSSGIIQLPDTINFPIETSGEGVLGYHYKGSQEYYVIKNWIKLKPIFYP